MESSSPAAPNDRDAHTQRAKAVLVPDDVMKIVASDLLAATYKESLAADLALLWSLFEATGNDKYAGAMIREIDNVRPGAKYGPQTSTKGVKAFFDFEHQLTKEESETLIQEVQKVNSGLRDLDPALVQAVHAALHSPAENETEGASKLGDTLPRVALCFFLDCCLKMAIASDFYAEVVLEKVKKILTSCGPFVNNSGPCTLP